MHINGSFESNKHGLEWNVLSLYIIFTIVIKIAILMYDLMILQSKNWLAIRIVSSIVI